MVSFITELNSENFENITQNEFTLVDVKTEWCGPCRQLSPIIDQLSIDYQGRLTVGKLDADQNKEILSKLGVRNIPTILLYKNGEIVEKSVGMTTKEKLSELIEAHLN